MLNTIQQLEPRFKMLIYVACLGNEENVFELFRFAPLAYEKSFVGATRELLSLPQKERTRLITKELKDLMRSSKTRSLGDVHPGWFLNFLKEEGAQTVSLILKYLPGEVVEYVLKHLPPEIRKRLNVEEDKVIPEEIVQLVQRRFEIQFSTLAPPEKGEEIGLSHLYFLKVEKLLSFFRELGLEQLARAFKEVDKIALKALLNRLLVQDAKEFQSKIKNLERVSSRELKEAQMLLLNLSLESIDPEFLFLEVGIAFFSRSIRKEELEFIRALQFKLPPRYGYLLKRYVDGSLISSKQNVTEWVKKQVLEKFHTFA